MRITVIASFFLACGVIYDSTALVASRSDQPPITSQAPHIWPEVKHFVDTHALIRTAAKKHNVPAAVVKSIVAAESNFDPNVVSCKGAVGLMQLMPATAQEYGADPAVPEQNVDAGTQYLGRLLKKYSKYRNGLSRAIAAYNAGPAVVDHYRGIPPFRETRTYVTRVLAFIRLYQKDPG